MKSMLERLEELQRRQREIFGDVFDYPTIMSETYADADADAYAKEACPLEFGE